MLVLSLSLIQRQLTNVPTGALLLILLVGSLAHKLRISTKATPEEMYFAVPEKSEA